MQTDEPRLQGGCRAVVRRLVSVLGRGGAPHGSMADTLELSLKHHGGGDDGNNGAAPAAARGGRAVSAARPPLSAGSRLAYCFFRLPLSSLDFTFRPARQVIWVDTLGQTLSSQASLISAVKSLDLLLGFTVGKASDNTRTRWGRRKPFIAVAFPLALLAFFLFVNAPSVGLGLARAKPRPPPCTHLVLNTSSPAGCPALKDCLERAMQQGEIDRFDFTSPSRVASLQSGGWQLSFWFALLYATYLACAYTCSQIPYDALGMELTDSYDERSSLFGLKTLFQFVGYAATPLLNIGLSALLADDLVALYSMLALAVGSLAVLAWASLLCNVVERPPPPEDHTILPVPIVPSARRVLANKPYLVYLLMKMPLSLVSLMPSNLAALWVKHNMALEAWNSMYNAVLMFALVGAMASIGVLVRSAQQYGKAAVLQAVLLVSGLLYLAVSFVPGAFFAQHPVLLVPVGALIGVGQALGFVLPDAMLADIIDYAELHSGSRDEGMYTVIETNLQQFVEIAGGVFPMVLLAGAGYEPLGGCSCGCGVSCGRAIGMPYARWHCPGDVGYSCTGKGGSELLFAPEEPAVAPCAAQSEHVQSLISLFFLAIPGLLALIAAIPAGKMPITARVHAAILAAIAARDSGGDAGEGGDAGGEREVIDPVYGEPVQRPPNTAASLLHEHFSPSEWQSFPTLGSLRAFLVSRLLLWVALAAALVAGMAYSGVEAAVTFGCLLLSALFILIPWDGVRLYALSGPAASSLVPARTAPP
mmetsp:Transcript_33893/g.100971  ORF Transcript_33893/g.100971 Transcript_33893/m.100971 type:complete len:759 (+) Transcript_33893:85-2361(+)